MERPWRVRKSTAGILLLRLPKGVEPTGPSPDFIDLDHFETYLEKRERGLAGKGWTEELRSTDGDFLPEGVAYDNRYNLRSMVRRRVHLPFWNLVLATDNRHVSRDLPMNAVAKAPAAWRDLETQLDELNPGCLWRAVRAPVETPSPRRVGASYNFPHVRFCPYCVRHQDRMPIGEFHGGGWACGRCGTRLPELRTQVCIDDVTRVTTYTVALNEGARGYQMPVGHPVNPGDVFGYLEELLVRELLASNGSGRPRRTEEQLASARYPTDRRLPHFF